MRRVERPLFSPQVCAATLRGEDKGWWDTGIDLRGVDPHVYLCDSAVETMAAHMGWASPGQVAEHAARTVELEREVADLRAQLAEADSELNAIHILKGRGYAAAKRPGRPPSKQAA